MWFKFILMLSCLYDKKFVIPQNAIRFILIFVWSQFCHSLIILTLYPYVIFMGNFNIFFLSHGGSAIISINGTDSHTENYQSLFHQIYKDIFIPPKNVF